MLVDEDEMLNDNVRMMVDEDADEDNLRHYYHCGFEHLLIRHEGHEFVTDLILDPSNAFGDQDWMDNSKLILDKVHYYLNDLIGYRQFPNVKHLTVKLNDHVDFHDGAYDDDGDSCD